MDILKIYVDLFKRRKWLSIVTILVYITFILAYYIFLKDKIDITDSEQSKLEKYKVEYFTLVDEILTQKDSCEISIESFRYGFNSLNRKANDKLFDYGFINILEDYLVHIFTNKDKYNKEKYVFVTNLLKNELKQEPYSQLPNDQRRILKNLENAIQKSDSTSAIYNLTELNDVLLNTNNEIRNLERESKWTLPLGIVGLVLTILFGIMTILSPISYKKMRDIMEETLKKE